MPTHGRRVAGSRRAWLSGCAMLLALAAVPDALATVYRWVDGEGVIHLSSERPPAGVAAERIEIPGTRRRASAPLASYRVAAAGSSAASAPRVPGRAQLLNRLQTRECVIALEALERKTSGAEPTSAGEIRRLKQTADLNCSQDPARRRQEEQMAIRLRQANGPACAEARNRLADMLGPGSNVPRDQLRIQQSFVDQHCTPPVR